MDEAKALEVRQWMLKARRDLASARVLALAEPPLLDTAVYHCQQAAEKALKAWLTWQDVPFMKVHDLTALVSHCTKMDEDFAGLAEAAETLTPYATAFRYPGRCAGSRSAGCRGGLGNGGSGVGVCG